MNIDELKIKIQTFEKDNKIYLLESLSEFAGFFVYNGIPMFLVWNISGNKTNNSIKTNLLEMETYVKIQSIQNSSSYQTGYYNILSFVGSINSDEFFSFVELCSLYSKNIEEISFTDFFHAMLELFQLPEEQQFKNALGLYGELKFLEYIYKTYNVNLTDYWHLSGSFSQFDISTKLYNIEIKTTLTDNVVKIKHKQIFNEHNNYLVSIVCEKYDSGETLEQLIKKNNNIFSNLSFAIKLKKELKKINSTDIQSLKFYMNELHIYKADTINPFKLISDDITELTYNYNLSEQIELDNNSIITLLKS